MLVRKLLLPANGVKTQQVLQQALQGNVKAIQKLKEELQLGRAVSDFAQKLITSSSLQDVGRGKNGGLIGEQVGTVLMLTSAVAQPGIDRGEYKPLCKAFSASEGARGLYNQSSPIPYTTLLLLVSNKLQIDCRSICKVLIAAGSSQLS